MATEQQPITFGEYVRRLRRASGWTAVTAADATGIASTHLSRLENDRMRPNAETVVQLHNALGGDLVEMLHLAACVPMELLALIETQPDVFAQGYHESGRERHDLVKAVQTLQEFVRRYKAERDEARAERDELVRDVAIRKTDQLERGRTIERANELLHDAWGRERETRWERERWERIARTYRRRWLRA